ncbi:MAG TPA: TetR/AcrR family transcriptional regulator, partial [Acholeplasma sp.]|nr:TetR/AcrR family transcriptional regulator [Acholeplasma sp.]
MPKDTVYRLTNIKQNAILNAAIKEFSEREVKNAKVSNIIKDSKISRGSFYQYFINIEDLYH